jgi:hypothetical protein
MYAEAFFETDMETVVRAGLEYIPEGSQYYECVNDVLTWYGANPNWEDTWQLINNKYHLDPNYRQFSCDTGAFNIDAKINGAYVVVGLLYGHGDPNDTITISMRCGQDSDCNPSSAAGILFTSMGYSNVPSRFKSALNEGTYFSYTDYNFPLLMSVCESLARQAVVQEGGSIEDDPCNPGEDIFVVPVSTPVPSALLQSWDPDPPINPIPTQKLYWWSDGGDSNLWSDANNWYPYDGNVPGPWDIVHIGKGNGWTSYPGGLAAYEPIGSCLIDSSVNAECYQLYISNGSGDTGGPRHLEVTGGSLTVKPLYNDWLGLIVGGVDGGSGSVSISDGNVVVGNTIGWSAGQLIIGVDGGTGTVTMTGGKLYCYHLDCPEWDWWWGHGEGHLNLHGGTFYTTADEGWVEFWMGEAGEAASSSVDITEGKAIISSHDESEKNWLNMWVGEGKIEAYGGDPNYAVCVGYNGDRGETRMAAMEQECVSSDLNGDCAIDYFDVKEMADAWLMSGHDVNAVEPNQPVGRWSFDSEGGSGSTANNSGSLGGGWNGTLVNMNNADWVSPGASHPDACEPNYALDFDGTNDYVDIPDFNSAGGGFTTDTLTITAWIRRDGTQNSWTGLVYCTRNDGSTWEGSVCIAGLSLGDDSAAPSSLNHLAYHWDGDVGWQWRSGLDVNDGEWTFAAVVVEPNRATMYMMPAGGAMQSAVNYEDHMVTTFDKRWTIGKDERGDWGGNRCFDGRIDDVHIYDYALSAGEICYAAEGASGLYYQPVSSLADIDGSDLVDFNDYGIMANNWLVGK